MPTYCSEPVPWHVCALRCRHSRDLRRIRRPGSGNLLVGLDDDAVGLERIDEVCVILLHQQGRNDLIQFQRVFRAFDQGYLEESIIQAYILSRQVLKPPTDLAFVTIP